MRLEAAPSTDDTWVTIFGFAPGDLPAVLREFQRCGDILQWGTFGCGGGPGAGGAPANFVHVQFANRYGAQRALLKNGEQLSPALIVGVKPLDPRHRQIMEAYGAGSGAGAGAAMNGAAGGAASPGPRVRGLAGGGTGAAAAAAVAAARPYKVDTAAVAAAALPQPSRSLMQKLSEFVLGV